MPWGPLLGPWAEAPGCLSTAAGLHCQGAVLHLLRLGLLRALQRPLQDRRHPAGVLQPAHRHGNLHPARGRSLLPPFGSSRPFRSVLPPAHVPSPLKNQQRCWHWDFQAWAGVGSSWWPPSILPGPGQCQPNLPMSEGGEKEGGFAPQIPAPQDSAGSVCGVGGIWSCPEPLPVSLSTFRFLPPSHEHTLASLGCLWG